MDVIENFRGAGEHRTAHSASALQFLMLTNTHSVAPLATTFSFAVLANTTAAARCTLPSTAPMLANLPSAAELAHISLDSMNARELFLRKLIVYIRSKRRSESRSRISSTTDHSTIWC